MAVKDIFDPGTVDEFVSRIGKLSLNTKAKWGKMNVDQMLKHCSVVIEIQLGRNQLKRSVASYLFGKILVKRMLREDKPYRRNLPTAKTLIVIQTNGFKSEKNNLSILVQEFKTKSKSEFEGRIHPFFGKMTSKEWNTCIYKHLDHHLRQFGV